VVKGRQTLILEKDIDEPSMGAEEWHGYLIQTILEHSIYLVTGVTGWRKSSSPKFRIP
jgi:hypothetical protein